MARTTRKRLKIEPSKHKCRECAHSYDWHSKAMDGSLILCRCQYDEGSKWGKWCKFLNDAACDNFKNRVQ